MLFTMSTSDMRTDMKIQPWKHWNDVQVFYFYDSRMPNNMSKELGVLTQDLLERQYGQRLKDERIRFYKIDLASPNGEAVGRKLDITMTGLVVSRRNRARNLTQIAYSMVLTDPVGFQQHLAYTIEKLLPSKYRTPVTP